MPILAGLGSPQEMRSTTSSGTPRTSCGATPATAARTSGPTRSSRSGPGTMETMRTRLISCYNCPMKCGATISVDRGICTYMMKCFSKLTYTMAAMSDLDFGFKIAQKATEYGVDGFSAPQIMAFALELLEAGILTDADFPGMPADNEGRFYWLLDRIVRREGIGDVLADGTYWAAKRIGKGAEAFAHNNIKKHEQLPLKLGMLNPDLLPDVLAPARRSTSRRSRATSRRRPSRRGRSARRSSRTGSRSPTRSSSSTSWTGSCAARSRSRTTRRIDATCEIVRLAGEDALHRRRARACAPACRRSRSSRRTTSTTTRSSSRRRRARHRRGGSDAG